MVGVPRGKRCEMCKERRRKCDGGSPSCSLCTRLKCPCIRLGKQFTFVGSRHDLPAGSASNNPEANASSSGDENDPEGYQNRWGLNTIPAPKTQPMPYSPPTSPDFSLAQQFSWMLSEKGNLGYNLTATFGEYLFEIPQHIGTCPALDAAVQVVVAGYTSFRVDNDSMNLYVARKYSNALLRLRDDVDRYKGRHLPLIIAAVMLLAVFENMDGTIAAGWMAHAGGAARLIRNPEFDPRQSTLSRELLKTARGTIVYEAIMTETEFDPNSRLWHDALDVPTYKSTLHKEAYRYLALMPSLRKSVKALLIARRDTGVTPPTWDQTFAYLRQVATEHLPVINGILQELESCIESTTGNPATFHASLDNLRTLKFAFPAMDTHLMLHSWLSFHEPAAATIVAQVAQRICSYIPLAMSFRPLGSAHLTVPLHTAYIGIRAPSQKIWIRDQLNTVHKDIQGPRAAKITLASCDWWADTLSLRFLAPVTAPWGSLNETTQSILPEEMTEWTRQRAARRGEELREGQLLTEMSDDDADLARLGKRAVRFEPMPIRQAYQQWLVGPEEEVRDYNQMAGYLERVELADDE